MGSMLISRFLLELRYMNAYPNGTTRKSHFLPTFQVASYAQSAIVNDFGDHILNHSADMDVELEEQSARGNVDQASQESPYVNDDVQSGVFDVLDIWEVSSNPEGDKEA
jgi:hypothetical protein